MRWSLLLLVACSYAPKPGDSPTGDDAPVDTCAGSGLEACNGLDDDCDGDTDEGFSVGMPCDSDDSDQCSEGVLTCEGTCTETVEAKVEICNGAVDEDCNELTDCADETPCEDTPFCCVGMPDGPAHTIGNTCVTDDFGSSGSSDNLEVYCCAGQARFCLSKEACPWRAGCPAGNTKTCSRGGLGGSLKMAVAECDLWKGQTDYGCSLDEQITFP